MKRGRPTRVPGSARSAPLLLVIGCGGRYGRVSLTAHAAPSVANGAAEEEGNGEKGGDQPLHEQATGAGVDVGQDHVVISMRGGHAG